MASTWNSTYKNSPAGTDTPSTLDNQQRTLREDIEVRMENEHNTFEDSTAGASAVDWRHKAGSAVAFYQSAAPTNQPGTNGSVLASGDAGRMWWDSDTDELKIWDGSAFQSQGRISGTLNLGSDLTGMAVTAGSNDYLDMYVGVFTSATTTSTSYTKISEFLCPFSGTIRIGWNSWGNGGTVYSKVYLNGVATGVEKSTTATVGSPASFTDDITITVGDLIQIYVKVSTGGGWINAIEGGVTETLPPILSRIFATSGIILPVNT